MLLCIAIVKLTAAVSVRLGLSRPEQRTLNEYTELIGSTDDTCTSPSASIVKYAEESVSEETIE